MDGIRKLFYKYYLLFCKNKNSVDKCSMESFLYISLLGEILFLDKTGLKIDWRRIAVETY